MGNFEKRLEDGGYILPAPLKVPEGVVLPFPEVNLRGNRAIISGAGPLQPDGQLAGPFGKVGTDVTIEDAAHLAELTGLVMIAGLKRTLGDLDRVTGWVRVFAMVQSAPDFYGQPRVINGFSNLILEIFGAGVGQHARSAVGMAALPMNIAVEIEAEVEFV